MDLSASTSSEPQIDFNLATPQLISTDNHSNLNRRVNFLKTDNTDKDKDKQVLNIRPDCGVSPKILHGS